MQEELTSETKFPSLKDSRVHLHYLECIPFNISVIDVHFVVRVDLSSELVKERSLEGLEDMHLAGWCKLIFIEKKPTDQKTKGMPLKSKAE